MTRITERLRAGDRLLLDGGTGSELQRRGVDVLLGSTGRLKAWSATANLAAGDVVRQVHLDYLRVGADIITSNNFWTSPSRLATLDAGEDWRTYADAAARNALAAREAGNPQAYVAGGIAPPALQDRDTGDLASDVARMGESAFASEIGDHARLLAAAGVDLILLEYLGLHRGVRCRRAGVRGHRSAAVRRHPPHRRRRARCSTGNRWPIWQPSCGAWRGLPTPSS